MPCNFNFTLIHAYCSIPFFLVNCLSPYPITVALEIMLIILMENRWSRCGQMCNANSHTMQHTMTTQVNYRSRCKADKHWGIRPPVLRMEPEHMTCTGSWRISMIFINTSINPFDYLYTTLWYKLAIGDEVHIIL